MQIGEIAVNHGNLNGIIMAHDTNINMMTVKLDDLMKMVSMSDSDSAH